MANVFDCFEKKCTIKKDKVAPVDLFFKAFL